MDEALRSNRELWDAWTRIHVASAVLRRRVVPAPVNGPIRLADYELEEVGPVEGRTLLHLQCHFGLDTLSWARLGATVTGVDFSDEAIAAARALAAEIGDPGEVRPVEPLRRSRQLLDGTFDIVYTSCGVLGWLPDIASWARVAAHFVRPGGIFYIDRGPPGRPGVRGRGRRARRAPARLSRTGRTPSRSASRCRAPTPTRGAPTDGLVEYGWDHSLGEIVTALIDAGLRIEFLHEFDFVALAGALPRRGRGRALAPPSRLRRASCRCFFSLKATRPGLG